MNCSPLRLQGRARQSLVRFATALAIASLHVSTPNSLTPSGHGFAVSFSSFRHGGRVSSKGAKDTRPPQSRKRDFAYLLRVTTKLLGAAVSRMKPMTTTHILNTYSLEDELSVTAPIDPMSNKQMLHFAELKVSYRRKSKKSKSMLPRVKINAPELAITYLRQLWDTDTIQLREEFLLICLSSSLVVNGWIRLHTGGLQGCPVDIRLILGIALQTASSAIIIAHNHPSDDTTPSREDRTLTTQIAQACRIMGIRFVDHVILTESDAYSFRDNEPGLFM